MSPEGARHVWQHLAISEGPGQFYDVCRGCLALAPRSERPLDWTMTQNNLGNALQALGERESGTARLEEAVAAFREALQERTRAHVPLDWAMTQNNLGLALTTLGEREGGMARLTEAIATFREALKELTRARVPLKWAVTQMNLGNAPERSAVGRAGQRGWRRPFPLTARPCRN
jgi:tetratricopeptide (TPR) repeat protein